MKQNTWLLNGAPMGVARAAAALPMILGAVVLASLSFRPTVAGAVAKGWSGFTAAEALACVLLGTALSCRLGRGEERWQSCLRRLFGQTAALLAVALGFDALCTFTLGGKALLGDWLARSLGAAPVTPGKPERLAFPSALCAMLLGLGLAFLDVRLRRAWLSQSLAVASLLIAFLALIGYACNVAEFYGGLTAQGGPGMSAPAMACFLTLGTGLLCARAERGLMAVLWSHTPGGVLARWLILAPALGLLLTGVVYLVLLRLAPVQHAVRTWALGLSNLLFVTAPILAAAHALHRAGLQRDEAHQALERRVQERTAELTNLNAALRTEVLERREAEQALREARDRLQKQAAELEQRVAERTAKLRETIGELEAFSYSVAHDMRAPLRGMQGFARLLLDEHARDLDEEAHGYLERIASSATRMDMLIQDVLQYTRILRTESLIAPVDLDRFVRHLLATYLDWQPPKADILIEGTLPTALAHEGFLTQCVSNLIGNAVRFVAPGVTPRVRIWAEERAAAVLLFVQDNGIGIADKDHDRVFRLFERLNPAQLYEGTGIGLTIVRKAAERMGGSVGFESVPGQGSKFWIQLQKPASTGD